MNAAPNGNDMPTEQTLTMKDAVRGPAVTVSADTSVKQVARLMEDSGYSFLPVVSSGMVLGVVTGRDLATRVMAHGLDQAKKVGDVMSTPVRCLPTRATGSEAIQLMRKHRIRRIVIVDNYGGVVGVISPSNMLGYGFDSEVLQLVRELAGSSTDQLVTEERFSVPGLYVG